MTRRAALLISASLAACAPDAAATTETMGDLPAPFAVESAWPWPLAEVLVTPIVGRSTPNHVTNADAQGNPPAIEPPPRLLPGLNACRQAAPPP